MLLSLMYEEENKNLYLYLYLYMTNGLLIYREIFAHFLIYEEALPHI
jgi:hypothetical protein